MSYGKLQSVPPSLNMKPENNEQTELQFNLGWFEMELTIMRDQGHALNNIVNRLRAVPTSAQCGEEKCEPNGLIGRLQECLHILTVLNSFNRASIDELGKII
jgi:hypothetical protein